MKFLCNLKNNKKGFTLIEMIVATVILAILMFITMGMISSSGKLYSRTARMSIDKKIGDSVFKMLEDALKYSTHLELAKTNYNKINPITGKHMHNADCSREYDQGFYLEKSSAQPDTGYLMHMGSSEGGKKYRDTVFNKEFYQGRTISYKIEKFNYKYVVNDMGTEDTSDDVYGQKQSQMHVKLTVDVYYKGKKVYTSKPKTISCLNLGLLLDYKYKKDNNGNYILDENGKKVKELLSNSNIAFFNCDNNQNPYINFCTNEQLSISASEGYELHEEASLIQARYNYINKKLAEELNSCKGNPAQMQAKADDAREQIMHLFGITDESKNFISNKYKFNSQLKYFNKVECTKEELFYGVLNKKYSVNGPVAKSSFRKFCDKNFLSNTTFTKYKNDMVQLILYNVQSAKYAPNQNSNYPYTGSNCKDYNMYSVKWQNWFTGNVDLSKPKNVLGNKSGKSSDHAYIVYHPIRRTWYYMPSKSNFFSNLWDNLWNKDHKPIEYNISKKESFYVMLDIDTNSVSQYLEFSLGWGKYKKDFKIDNTENNVWSSLPVNKLDVDT